MIYTELSMMYLVLFMDDMTVFEDDKVLIEETKIKLFSHFKMKDLDIIKCFLGLEIEHNSCEDVIISQKCYIECIFK